MFKIVALAYILLAGKPVVDEPYKYTLNNTFASQAACSAYLTSEAFAIQRQILVTHITAAIAAAKAKATSDADPDAIDDTKLPGVVVTASCEDDDRL